MSHNIEGGLDVEGIAPRRLVIEFLKFYVIQFISKKTQIKKIV
jgi:hypothetical protein